MSNNLFVVVTMKENNKEVYLRATSVMGVMQKEYHSEVYVVGDPIPYKVKENALQVIKIIGGHFVG